MESQSAQAERHAFESALAISWPPEAWRDEAVLVAVSGGADSVALLRGLAAIRRPGRGALHVAHFNPGGRGAAADADAAFVAEVCARLAVPCLVGQADSRNLSPSQLYPEEMLRRERYEFLRSTSERIHARFTVTAHTADDQAETVLFRIARGTGLSGLRGIPRARPFGAGTLLRPMLDAWREDVLDYLDDLRQEYRCDKSNLDLRLRRNRIRHEILPLLRTHINSRSPAALVRVAALASEIQTMIEPLVVALLERCVRTNTPERIVLDSSALAETPQFICQEVLARSWRAAGWPLGAMSYEAWQALLDMIQNCPTGLCTTRRSFPGGVNASLHEGRLTLVRNAT